MYRIGIWEQRLALTDKIFNRQGHGQKRHGLQRQSSSNKTKSLHFYLAKKLNTNKHYLRTSFILASSNLLIAKGNTLKKWNWLSNYRHCNEQAEGGGGKFTWAAWTFACPDFRSVQASWLSSAITHSSKSEHRPRLRASLRSITDLLCAWCY